MNIMDAENLITNPQILKSPLPLIVLNLKLRRNAFPTNVKKSHSWHLPITFINSDWWEKSLKVNTVLKHDM